MQDRYIGDVGDFGKYGLLRILCGVDSERMLRLGIVWYLFPDEGHNSDGKHVTYLQKNDHSFRKCDVSLYDKLRHLLFDETGLIEAKRKISIIEKSGILPEDTLFYSEPLSYKKADSASTRGSLRERWIADSLAATKSADIVFLDPDNGIECKSVTRIKNRGPKYVYWDDLDAFVERGQSVITYYHLNRNDTHPEQVRNMQARLKERFKNGFEIMATTYKRGTSRAYLIVAAPNHKDLLRRRFETIHTSLWSRHFVLG